MFAVPSATGVAGRAVCSCRAENSEYNMGMVQMLAELRDWLTGRIPYPSLETSLFLMAVGAAVLWLGIRLAASG